MKIYAVKLKDGKYLTRGSVYSDPGTPEFWPDLTRATKWANAFGGDVEVWEATPEHKIQVTKPESYK